MQLFEIGIRTKAEAKKRLIEIANGRRFEAHNQPTIWRTSENAAIKYMRDHDINVAKLVFVYDGESDSSLVDLSANGESGDSSLVGKHH